VALFSFDEDVLNRGINCVPIELGLATTSGQQ